MKKAKPEMNSVGSADDPAFPTDEAAKYLGGLHVKTLLKLAKLGEIASIQLAPGGPVKFKRSALNSYLERHERPARR